MKQLVGVIAFVAIMLFICGIELWSPRTMVVGIAILTIMAILAHSARRGGPPLMAILFVLAASIAAMTTPPPVSAEGTTIWASGGLPGQCGHAVITGFRANPHSQPEPGAPGSVTFHTAEGQYGSSSPSMAGTMAHFNATIPPGEIVTAISAQVSQPWLGAWQSRNGQFNLSCPEPPPTGTPTATPVTPTSTPVTPTSTPVTPTATPVTPTSTPVTPTSTPVTPTATPEPEPEVTAPVTCIAEAIVSDGYVLEPDENQGQYPLFRHMFTADGKNLISRDVTSRWDDLRDAVNQHPSLSYNNCRQVFTSDGWLWFTGPNGESPRQWFDAYTGEPMKAEHPDWGRHYVVFTELESGALHLTVEGGWILLPLTDGGGEPLIGRYADWHPNSRVITFADEDLNISFVELRHTEDGVKTLRTWASGYVGFAPRFSSDGSEVLFTQPNGQALTMPFNETVQNETERIAREASYDEAIDSDLTVFQSGGQLWLTDSKGDEIRLTGGTLWPQDVKEVFFTSDWGRLPQDKKVVVGGEIPEDDPLGLWEWVRQNAVPMHSGAPQSQTPLDGNATLTMSGNEAITTTATTGNIFERVVPFGDTPHPTLIAAVQLPPPPPASIILWIMGGTLVISLIAWQAIEWWQKRRQKKS